MAQVSATAPASAVDSSIVLVSFPLDSNSQPLSPFPYNAPPSLSPPPQRDGPNLFMTLHRRKVDDSTIVPDGCQPVHVPAGWQIADGSADDVRVCAAHPWQSGCLVFADGDSCGTAACSVPSYIGNAQFALQ